jgi:hypothetical protein
MKKDLWCAFESIGAVKIKQPKDRALDRLHYYLQRELSGFPTVNKYTSKSLKSQGSISDCYLKFKSELFKAEK